MGRPKALLPWRGLPFVEHVCSSLRASGVEDRVVVLGRASAEILSFWKPSGEKVAVNPRPQDGQIASLRVGLDCADRNAEAFFVCLVDQPTISLETYKKIISAWLADKESIVIPRFLRPGRRTDEPPYKRGHPIIIPAARRHLCFEGPLDKGLHWVTHHPSVKVMDLVVEDAGIIRDFDTPEQYEQLK